MEDDKGCSLSPFTATLDRGRVAMDVNNGASTWIREIVDTQQRGNKDGGGFSLSLLPLSLPYHTRSTIANAADWQRSKIEVGRKGRKRPRQGWTFSKTSLFSSIEASNIFNPRYHEVKCHLKKLALSARERKIHEIRLLYATSQFLGTCIRVIVALGNSFAFLQNFFSLFVNPSLFFARYFYNSCIQFFVYRYRCAWELDQVEISETRRQGGKRALDEGRISRSELGREAITGVWVRFSHKSFLDGAVSYISLRVNSP